MLFVMLDLRQSVLYGCITIDLGGLLIEKENVLIVFKLYLI